MEFLKSFKNSLKLKNTHPNLAGGYTSRRPNNFNKEESLNYVLGQSYCNGANGYLLRSVYKDRAIVSFNFSSSPISFLLGQNRQAWPSSSGNTLIVYLVFSINPEIAANIGIGIGIGHGQHRHRPSAIGHRPNPPSVDH